MSRIYKQSINVLISKGFIHSRKQIARSHRESASSESEINILEKRHADRPTFRCNQLMD